MLVDDSRFSIRLENLARTSRRLRNKMFVLRVGAARIEDGGLYQCSIATRRPEARSVVLTVAEPTSAEIDRNLEVNGKRGDGQPVRDTPMADAGPSKTSKNANILEITSNKIVTVGAKTELKCYTVALQRGQMIEWRKLLSNNDITTLTSGRDVVSHSPRISVVQGKFIDEDVATLIINETRFSDGGVYQCVVTGVEPSTSETALTVVNGRNDGLDEFPVSISDDITESAGTNITLTCIVNGLTRRSTVEWERNSADSVTTISYGRRLSIDDPRFDVYMTQSGGETTSNLNIYSLNPDDAGTYICKTTSDHPIMQSVAVEVRGLADQSLTGFFTRLRSSTSNPTITSISRLTTVRTGKTLNLECFVRGLSGSTTVEWQKKEGRNYVTLTKGTKVILEDSRVDIDVNTSGNDDVFVLTLSEITSSDQGTYQCETTNQTPDSKTVDVSVRGSSSNEKPEIVDISPDMSVRFGATVELECFVSGLVDGLVRWRRTVQSSAGLVTELLTEDDQKISSNSRMSIKKQMGRRSDAYILMISDVRRSDSATYTCLTVNIDTPAERSLDLTVEVRATRATTEEEQIICEDKTETVQCRNRQTIELTDIKYGRENNAADICKSKTSGRSCTYTSVRDTVLEKFRDACDDERSCQIRASNSQMGGDPCSGTKKYARVIYNCLDDRSSSGPEIVEISEDTTLTVGRTLTLKCHVTDLSRRETAEWQTVDSDDSVTVLTRGTRVISTERRISIDEDTSNDDETIFTLSIRRSVEEDASRYRCKTTDSDPVSDDVVVSLSDSTDNPKIVDISPRQNLRTNEDMVIECTVMNLGDNTVEWQKVDSNNRVTVLTRGTRIVAVNRRLSIDRERDQGNDVFTLTLRLVLRDDAGTFRCETTNSNPDHEDVVLSVRSSGATNAKITEVSPSPRANVQVDSKLILECFVTDLGSETIEWQKVEGRDVTVLTRGEDVEVRDRRVSIIVEGFRSEEIFVLEITNTQRSDSGTYRCEITGSSEESLETEVNVGSGSGGSEDPEIVEVTSDKTIRTGSDLVLECFVTGLTSSTVEWQLVDGRNIEVLTRGEDRIISDRRFSTEMDTDGDEDIFTLTVTNIRNSDEGTYRCETTNDDPVSEDVEVTVRGSGGREDPEIVEITSDKTVRTGNDLVLECFVTDLTSSTVEWQLVDGRNIEVLTRGEDRIISDRRFSTEMDTAGDEDIFTLTVTNIRNSDEGTYRCETTNDDPVSKDVEVTVGGSGGQDDPEIVEITADRTVSAASDVVLECFVTGLTSSTVEWQLVDGRSIEVLTRGEDRITSDRRFSTEMEQSGDEDIFVLTISNIRNSDEGTYRCETTNDDPVSEDVEVNVRGSGGGEDLDIVEISSDTTVSTGDDLELECFVTGLTSSTVEWQLVDGRNIEVLTRNEDRIISDRRFSTEMDKFGNEDVFTLTVTNIRNSDEGTYRCETTNDDPVSEDVEVTVRGSGGGEDPEIVEVTSDKTIRTGNDLVLECFVTGLTSSTVEWQLVDGRNIEVLTRGEDRIISDRRFSTEMDTDGDEDIFTLTVTNIRNSDEGTYRCETTNDDPVSEDVEVTVTGSGGGEDPEIGEITSDTTVRTGNDLVLECFVTGLTSSTVEWQLVDGSDVEILTRGEDRIISNSRFSTEMDTAGDEDIFTLTVTNIRNSDEGTYRCETTNDDPVSEDVEVTVTGSGGGEDPEIVEITSDTTVRTGNDLVLECFVTGLTSSTIEWQLVDGSDVEVLTRGEDRIISDRRFSTEMDTDGDEDIFTLTVTNIRNSDEGTYRCETTNDDPVSEDVEVTVTGSGGGEDPEIGEITSDTTVGTGNDLVLECFVTGLTSSTVEWQLVDGRNIEVLTRGEDRIISDRRFSTEMDTDGDEDIFTLTVTNIRNSDEGTYRCETTNDDPVSEDVEVTVTGSGGGEDPEIGEITSDTTVRTGNDLVLECFVTGLTSSTVEWQLVDGSDVEVLTRGEDRIISDRRFSTEMDTDGDEDIFTLTVTNIRNSDEGSYRCETTNDDPVSEDVEVTVGGGGGPEIVVFSDETDVRLGRDLTLECTVTGLGSRNKVEWQLVDGSDVTVLTSDEDRITSDRRVSTVLSSDDDEDTYTLTVTDMDLDDAGTYRCEITGSNSVNEDVTVTVGGRSGITEITFISENTVLRETRDLVLVCDVTSLTGSETIEWQKVRRNRVTTLTRGEDVVLTSDSRIGVTETTSGNKKTFTLTITNVKTQDEGTYRCETTSRNSIQEDVEVQVLAGDATAEIVSISEDITVNENSDLMVECTVTGLPDGSEVEWQHIVDRQVTLLTSGTTRVTSNRNVRITKTSTNQQDKYTLTIVNVKVSDSGTYQCQVTGSDPVSESLEVTVGDGSSVSIVAISQKTDVAADKTLSLFCTVTGLSGRITIEWLKVRGTRTTTLTQGGNVIAADRRVDVKQSTVGSRDTFTLTIDNVASADAGVYRCASTDRTPVQKNVDVTVSGGSSGTDPEIMDITQDTDVVIGDFLELECFVTGLSGSTTVEWQKQRTGTRYTTLTNADEVVSSDSRISVLMEPDAGDTVFVLQIDNVRTSDEGTYRCITTDSNPVSSTVDVTVSGKK
ncbi:PREDICTED: muscle M-line assembly protein unc-89-like [Priapulus caudatus]|uniref:Muscle M-line assembly protein unc-89-like n=1 Tax=Priapulus caudatus TaxID=37621 RepID=A0ABM1ES97_PRICU|nr:PREDICTED: muscle M-line assembly protein unc-89-like [Priapulus caudatus]